jgi:hypothetical protein
MSFRAILGVALCAAVSGCTHHQLTRSTVLTTSTVADIQYRIVLMNLAMLSCHPEALPSHIDLADGVVQVNDEAAFGTSGGFTTTNSRFGIDRYGPSGSRQVTEQWGADAITDPRRITQLQDLYRAALGLPPLPPPNVIDYLRRAEAEMRKKGGGDKDGSDGGPSGVPSKASAEEDGSTPSLVSESSGGDGELRVPIEVLLTDVPPPGWFQLGGKKDVPKDACYVARYGDRYAWVMPDGMPGLARFTVTVLAVVKFSPGPAARISRGLAFTR